jgi:DNA-binding LytR/AlgR family response regulator
MIAPVFTFWKFIVAGKFLISKKPILSMIRAIVLENAANTSYKSRDFGGFEPALEPVKAINYSVFGQETALAKKPVYDQNDYILVKNEYKMIKLQVKDILYIEGKGNYISLQTSKFKLLTLQTMKKLEAFLLPYQFVRVHKSFIVSFHNVDSIDKHSIFINNHQIPISDTYRENLRFFLADNAKQL